MSACRDLGHAEWPVGERRKDTERSLDALNSGHRTPVEGLFHIGASTWPGPGLGAGSGTLVAHELLRPPAAERLARRIRALGRPRQA